MPCGNPCGHGFRGASWLWMGLHGGCGVGPALGKAGWWEMLCGCLVVGVWVGCLWWPLCWVECGPGGEGCMGLTFSLAYLFPQVCNACANCSNLDFVLFKIVFVFIVTVNIVNSISRPVVILLCCVRAPPGLS